MKPGMLTGDWQRLNNAALQLFNRELKQADGYRGGIAAAPHAWRARVKRLRVPSRAVCARAVLPLAAG